MVLIPGAPLLTVRRTGANTLAVCWPYPSAGYVLERSLGLEVLHWVPAASLPVHVSNEWQVTVTPPTEESLDESYCEYFRLQRSGP